MSSKNGMRNLGNTCYLNVVIQTFLSLECIHELLNKIRNPKPPAIMFLIDCLSSNMNTSQSPEPLYELYLSLFHNKRHMPEDAVECFIRLSQYLEDNLEKYEIDEVKLNRTQCSCNKFWFNQRGLSLVQELFFGILYNKMQCKNCYKEKSKFETFQILPIHTKNSNSITEGLIRLVTFTETIHHVECENCNNKNCIFTINQTFHRFPRVLMFEIVGDNASFQFDEVLIIDHMHGYEQEKLSYRVKTIVMYNGSHYNCVSYDSLSQQYMFIDDEKVTPIELKFSGNIRCLIYELV